MLSIRLQLTNMKVEITRVELLMLCRQAVNNSSSIALKNHLSKFPGCVERKPFINGDHYRLCEAWAVNQTEHELFIFYGQFYETIKLIEL